MPRLVTRSWHGLVHTSIEHGTPRSAHLGAPLGRQLSSIEVSPDDAALGIDKLVALQAFREARHGR